jgi:hypothetical protein
VFVEFFLTPQLTLHYRFTNSYLSPPTGSALYTYAYRGTGINGDKYSYSGCPFYLCSAGFYNPTFGASSSDCEACGEGKYSASTGATSDTTCEDCGEGKYSASTGATNDATCEDCGEGKYSTSTGAATCQGEIMDAKA